MNGCGLLILAAILGVSAPAPANALLTATPTISPAPGTYPTPQTVTMSDATLGAQIYYTTDGTQPACSNITCWPTTSTILYTGPITISSTTQIIAIAVASGHTKSNILSRTYTIQPTAAAPIFNPAGGTYTDPETVTISDDTPGAQVFYTTDGTPPTTSSTPYTGPIAINSTLALKAIAAAGGYSNGYASATYMITNPRAYPPWFEMPSFTYTSATIRMWDNTPGAQIYYTTDGTVPTPSSTPYIGPITIECTTTFEAMAAAVGYSDSSVASMTYEITALPTATPAFSVAAGTYPTSQTVSLTDATPGAQIYYTIDGNTPTTSSTPYSGPVTVSNTTTVQAIATAPCYSNSPVASATYTITLSAAAAPTFSPAAGTYASAQSVTISDTTPGAQIFYTTDGSPPTTSSARYAGPIAVATTTTVRAVATATGYLTSPVASAGYTIVQSGSTSYCYDGAGNMTAVCVSGQVCSCP